MFNQFFLGERMILTENALTVLERRYFIKDENGEPKEDWQGLIERVAKDISNGNEEKKRAL